MVTERKPAGTPDRLWDRYCIYAHNASQLGWYVKSFDEWMAS